MRKLYSVYFLIQYILGIFWTCWVMNLLGSGLTLQESCYAAAGWFLGIGLFEIPTGYIADRYGRKVSTIAGLVGMAFSFAYLSASTDVWHQFAALGLAGISCTLISGAIDAWAFNLARDGDSSLNSESFWLNLQLLGRVAMIVGAFSGAWLTGEFPGAAWWLVSLTAVVTAVIALGTPKGSADIEQSGGIAPMTQVRTTLSNPVVSLLLVAVAFWGLEAGIRNVIFQPYIIDLVDNSYLFLAFHQAVLAATRICGILFYKRVLSSLGRGPQLASLSLAAFAGAQVVAAFAPNYWVFLGAFVVAIFCLAWYFPIRQAIYNDQLPERVRATMLSIDSMVDFFCQAVSCLVLAQFVVRGEIAGYWLFGAGFLAMSLLMFLFATGQRGRHSENSSLRRAAIAEA